MPRNSTGRATLAVMVALASVAAVACTSSSSSAPATDALSVKALSTRPEYVTGGDVLVSVQPTSGGSLDGITVQVGDRDVTAAFSATGDHLTGLVSGLPDGDSTITATRGSDRGSLNVTGHPITGPLFSGPQQSPYVCTTDRNGLAPATDGNCSAPTIVETRDLGGVSTTIEKGVIDRSVYTIAYPETGWNGRLVYRFGGGCGASFSQGSGLVEAADPKLIGEGYAVATSTLNTFQTACNAVLSAEVALMVKEHFIETYGVPAFTIGEGGSGGAIQQIQTAQNYPGILDALAPTVPFPDAASIAPGVTDCGLLLHYYATAQGGALTDAQRVAINGHRTTGTCDLWNSSFVGVIDPTANCDKAIPKEQIYDPVSNPRGACCDFQDSNVNIYGRDPATGFANRALDNVGVQYGLQALNDGVITVDQFLDLNGSIGGFDVDGNIVPAREVGTEEALTTAYSKGQITTGAGLTDLPIILTNVYTDAIGDIHDRQRIFTIRERLKAADGTDDPNLALWTVPGGATLGDTLLGTVSQGSDAVAVLDRWLTAAAADTSGDPWATKLAHAQPADGVDTCLLPDGQKMQGAGIYDGDNACTQAYPVASDPRRVAGATLRNDIGKCQLTTVDPGSYRVTFTSEQIDRLQQVFPDGVCDWTRPGVGQVPPEGTWLQFG